MKVMVFTEGTVLMHLGGKNVSREERVRQSQKEIGSVHDYATYIPVGNAVGKLTKWKNQGATIYYLSSRRVRRELDAIREVLRAYGFPDSDNLVHRLEGESYKDVIERETPDVLVEDDCESIGGEPEMTYPSLRSELKQKVKSVVVKEFAGVDDLVDDPSLL